MKYRHELLHTLHLATGIPLSIYNVQSGIMLSYPDVLLSKTIIYAIETFRSQQCDSRHPLVINEQSFCFIALAELNPNSYIMLGPISPVKYSEKQLRHFLSQTSYLEDTEKILNMLIYGSESSIQNIINALILAVHILSDRFVSADDVHVLSHIFLMREINAKLVKKQYEASENEIFHTPKRYEDLLFEAIQKGNPEIFEKYRVQPVPGTIGKMSLNFDQQSRYLFVTTCSLVCRAAMEGGVDPETAYTLCDNFCQQMDSLKPPVNIKYLYDSMIYTYIDKVNEVQQKNNHYSPAIKDCCYYISKNIQNKLCLSDIAAYCGLSPRWLSQKFLKETGESITEYIQHVKLDRARQLLLYTDFPISDISNILQYSTQSYFTEQFKKRYHVTPKKFREEHCC